MEFTDVINNRFSCKKFSDKKIDKETLNKILNAAMVAPTAKNLQEHKIYVIESEEALKKIDNITPCRYNASTVLLVAFNKNNVFVYPGDKRDSGVEDASIVATHLMLAAFNENVDSCWINFFDPEVAKKEFNLSDEEEVLMLLDLGYKAEGVKPLPNHNKSKEFDEIIKYL